MIDQREVLLQRLQQHQTRVTPVTGAPSIAPAANAAPVTMAEAPSIAPAANAAPSVTLAANAAPTVAIQNLRTKKRERLMSLAEKVFQCLLEKFKSSPHCRPQRADIVWMLGPVDGPQYIKDSQHGYLCTDNIVQAACVNQFNHVVIGEGRLRIIATALSDSSANIADFRSWIIEELQETPPGIDKPTRMARLRAAWDTASNRPVLKQHKGEDVNVWHYFISKQLDLMDAGLVLPGRADASRLHERAGGWWRARCGHRAGGRQVDGRGGVAHRRAREGWGRASGGMLWSGARCASR